MSIYPQLADEEEDPNYYERGFGDEEEEQQELEIDDEE